MTSHTQAANGRAGGTAESADPQQQSSDVVADLLHVAQQVRRLLNQRLDAHKLSDVRFAVLSMVLVTESRGGCSQTELAARIEQSESSVSTLIDRMRADRLLYRLRAPSDRRRRRLVLTDEGRAALDSARRDYAELINAIRQTLDGDRQAALAALLQELSTALCDDRLRSLTTEDAGHSQSSTTVRRNDVSPAA